MTSIDFLVKELKSLHEKFTQSNIRYEYCASSNTHLVEITPLEFYNSVSYMECELDLENNFFEKFPLEELIFVSEESLSKITSPIFVIFSDMTGGFRTDFIEIPSFSNFIDLCHNDYQYVGETNYALAAYNTLWIHRGGKGNMKGGSKWWTWNIPFITKNWVRTSILLKDDTWEHETKGNIKSFYNDEWKQKQKSWVYDYTDSYDGEVIPTKIYVSEMEWRPKWLKCISLFAKTRRTIDIHFSKEVGKRKVSWKGGTLGCGWELLPNEEPLDCLKRMEKEREF